jgi:hypothetical protein
LCKASCALASGEVALKIQWRPLATVERERRR